MINVINAQFAGVLDTPEQVLDKYFGEQTIHALLNNKKKNICKDLECCAVIQLYGIAF